MFAQMIQTKTRLVDRCPGGAAWRRPGPNHPPGRVFPEGAFASECTTASQLQSLAFFSVADDITRSLCGEQQIWTFFVAKRTATTTVSVPQKNSRVWTSLRAPLADISCRWPYISFLNPQPIAPRKPFANFDCKSSP